MSATGAEQTTAVATGPTSPLSLVSLRMQRRNAAAGAVAGFEGGRSAVGHHLIAVDAIEHDTGERAHDPAEP